MCCGIHIHKIRAESEISIRVVLKNSKKCIIPRKFPFVLEMKENYDVHRGGLLILPTNFTRHVEVHVRFTPLDEGGELGGLGGLITEGIVNLANEEVVTELNNPALMKV